MERRNFIKNTAAASAFVGLSGAHLPFLTKAKKRHITILHTNDVHSHVEPFPKNDPNYAGMGGVSRRYSLIENIRAETRIHFCWMRATFFRARPILIFMAARSSLSL